MKNGANLSNNIPLIVDLDNSLINTDLFYQSSMGAFRKNPMLIFIYPFWFLRGKGYFKEQLVKRFSIDASTLPYNQTVIDYIKTRKKNGDQIILATASHKIYAFAIAKYLTINHTALNIDVLSKNKDLFQSKNDSVKPTQDVYLFDDVMASNAEFNLSAHNKADKLVQRFGKKMFDYIGDHKRDLPVWEASNLSILVNPSARIIRKTQHLDTLIL